jgi:hypothetical protein
MLRTRGPTSSVTHTAGWPGPGAMARPNTLVVLMKTKRATNPASAIEPVWWVNGDTRAS